MSVSLCVKLPSQEAIAIEAGGGDRIEALKARIAELKGYDVGSISLTFEEEELKEGNKVCDYPFEDQSEVVVVLGRKQAALLALDTMKWTARTRRLAQAEMNLVDEERFVAALELMHDADLLDAEVDKLLWNAVTWHKLKVVEVILSRGMVDTEKALFRNPVHEAASMGLEDALRILLRYMKTVPLNAERATPLHVAASTGNKRITELLIDTWPAQVNMVNRRNETALHCAAGLGHKRVVRVLLDRGADPSAKAKGSTPASVACNKNRNFCPSFARFIESYSSL
eukprot:TRINITY_DN1704_c0_g1_i1.p1 TRINITY_DN1704_c0_g1~~TRINITY_DN1704_c0_g1_i1.p1  ORF type:complete len:284 (+),score=63.69 TRINITY_DN1704_c0_g1_i1:865-1716(+)